jgi:uncharacterized protein (TIGR03086 family)
MIDLSPAAERMRELVRAVGEDDLDAPTPCADTTVGGLVDHVMGLSLAFRMAAHKQNSADGPGPSVPATAELPADWREQADLRLHELAEAWRDPAAWDGVTAAGGLELPAHEAGIVALNELVLHGWDLARATGQAFRCDPVHVEAVLGFTTAIAEGGPKARAGLFGEPVDVPPDAPAFDRALGLAGRDPAWTP